MDNNRLAYAIYSGAGNTFLMVDARNGKPFSASPSIYCSQFAVDGLILLEKSNTLDAKMRIFNRDGSEAEMCGNGLRCAVDFLKRKNLRRSEYHIETLSGSYSASFQEDEVRVDIPPPRQERWYLQVDVGRAEYTVHFLNTGVPHAVHVSSSITQLDVDRVGREICDHPLFAPERTNVNFIALKENSSLAIRTYERGVERETLACGTGAIASAFVAAKLYGAISPIHVFVQSGEKIKIFFSDDLKNISMMGPVELRKSGYLSH